MIKNFKIVKHRYLSYSFNVEHTKFHIWDDGNVVMSKWHTVGYHNKSSTKFNFFTI